jgi:hypothetical protein
MESLQKENFLEKYGYLEKLLKYYNFPIDRKNMNMNDYLMKIHKIIFALSGKSDLAIVEQIEQVFHILIENSVKMDTNSMLFKALVYFVQNGFDLFVKTLKSEKNISEKKFFELLLDILNSEEIAKSLNLNAVDIEKELNILVFKEVITKLKPLFVQKIFSFPLFFFKKNIHEDDEDIKAKIKKYIKEKYINKFYKTYNELLSEKKYDDLEKILKSKSKEEKKEIINLESNEEKNENKNEIKDNLIVINEEKENGDKDETKQNSDNSSNKEKDKIEKSEDSNKSEKIIINDNFNSENERINSDKENKTYTSQEIMEKINSIAKKFEEENKALAKKFEEENKKIKEENKALAKKFEEENKKIKEENKALAKKFEEEKKNSRDKIFNLETEVNQLNNKIKKLNDKLDLSILINNLGTQRDSYKASLDILLKFLNTKLELNIILNDDDEIWKQTKDICDKIINCGKMEKSSLEKIANSLISLLFCKDYSNSLVHGKGKFSKLIKSYYEDSQDIPIISIASYENMKIVTKRFFGSKVNESEEFKIINSLLFSKMQNWKENEMDYSKYFINKNLNCDNIMNDFNIAVEIMERYELTGKVDTSLEK